MEAFDNFIATNHKGSSSEDEKISREWLTFREIIRRDPGDTQAHNKHVNNLRTALLKEEVSKHMGSMGNDKLEREEQSREIEIDKNALLTISRNLKRNVLRHTKDPLNMLH